MKLPGIKMLVKLFFTHNTMILALLGTFVLSNFKHNSAGQDKILIDQLGYKPNDFKVAFVKNKYPGTFLIKDAKTNQTVFKGSTDDNGMYDIATGDNLFSLNFSTLTKPGSYYIELPSLSSTSQNFYIDNNVYNDCAVKALQSFYYQRCGTEINNGTIWKHPACHTKPAVFYDDPSTQQYKTGGWHDAGDYNKFVPTTAVSAAFLLYAYDYNPVFFYDGQLKIPESKDSIPDVLDEARWGLEWLIKMQRGDGGVYQKVSIKTWTDEHLPEKETDQQYIFGISSSATADVAAVTALGARLFEKFDKVFAMALLKSSLAAWNFLELHPGNVPEGGFKNPPDVYGGEYGDSDDSDERLWASIELYRTTGSNKFIKYFLANYQGIDGPKNTISYENTANFAYDSFLRINNFDLGLNAKSIITEKLRVYADKILTKIQSCGYGCALNPDEYYWGSNSVDLGYAFDLINAFSVIRQKKYLYGALDQLHYILGRNTFGISFVTGVGYNAVRYPYHQISMLKYVGNPFPGMVVGGPNKFSRLNGKIISDFPGKCYEDYQKNYYVNEPAINYTAPLVFVASYLAKPTFFNNMQDITKTINSN